MSTHTATTFYRQDRETGEITALTEAELRRYLQAHRTPPGAVLAELKKGCGFVLRQVWFNYAARRESFRPIVKLEEIAR